LNLTRKKARVPLIASVTTALVASGGLLALSAHAAPTPLTLNSGGTSPVVANLGYATTAAANAAYALKITGADEQVKADLVSAPTDGHLAYQYRASNGAATTAFEKLSAATAAVDEVQVVSVGAASANNFKLTFDGQQTGNLLAIGQNAAADAQGPIALTGLYPPGSTFKTVTVSAALQAGQVTPDSVVACPGTENIEGRQIPNDDNFDLGEVPLHTAFARSCNTTMGRLAVNLPPDGLTKAADQLGLGVDFTAPGMTTVTGKVPVADTAALRVEEGIGQGQVTASPFGMALVAAALARGSVPAPAIVDGQPGKADHAGEPLPPAVAEQVKSMMRETITNGTATQLQDIPDMLGKTGTAEYIDDQHAHGWFVGIDGDLALAVFISDAGSSGPAVDAAGRFLRAPR